MIHAIGVLTEVRTLMVTNLSHPRPRLQYGCIPPRIPTLPIAMRNVSQASNVALRSVPARTITDTRNIMPAASLNQTCSRHNVAGFSVVIVAWVTHNYRYHEQLNVLRDVRGTKAAVENNYELQFLLKAVKEEDIEVRLGAVEALCRHDDVTADTALLAAADDPNVKVRFQLATSLLTSPSKAAKRICEKLLGEQGGMVATAATRLAVKLDDPKFIPYIENYTFSEEKILRNYALNTILRNANIDYEKFISSYLEHGPPDGRIELLNRFLKAKAAPSIPPLLKILDLEDSLEKKELVIKILGFYSDGKYSADAQAWRQWWHQYSDIWHARRCLAVTWAPPDSVLNVGDIVWELNNKEVLRDINQIPDEMVKLAIIRKNKLVIFNHSLGRNKCHVFFIGTLNGRPVGRNHLVPRMLLALDLNP